MTKLRIDQVTKHALWNVYGNACFYCNKPLEWNDLNVDHIIPEHLKTDQVKLASIISEYNLSRTFSVNSLINLVPTHTKCNNRKSGQLFSKSATLFYLELTSKREPVIRLEIEKLKGRKNKGHLMAKLQVAVETDLISIEELTNILEVAKESNFISKEIKLLHGFEFVDAIYDSFYVYGNYSHLFDKEVLSGYLDVINDSGDKRIIRTLQEWRDATNAGYYPQTNADIKISAQFTNLDEFLEILGKAKPAKYSFISEPWVSLADIDKLSPSIIQDFEGELKGYIAKGLSVGDLVRQGVVTRNPSDRYQISLEFNGFETSLREQFRADFNNDGYEDIFVAGWVRATGGTLGFSFSTVLTRFSEKELIHIPDLPEIHPDFNITLWNEYIDGKAIYYFRNDSDTPIMDAVLFVNKPGKSIEEAQRSRNTIEIIYGTIPPHSTLDHKMDHNEEDQEIFGFPLLSGQFTSKDGTHFEIDTRNNAKQILFRSAYD